MNGLNVVRDVVKREAESLEHGMVSSEVATDECKDTSSLKGNCEDDAASGIHAMQQRLR